MQANYFSMILQLTDSRDEYLTQQLDEHKLPVRQIISKGSSAVEGVEVVLVLRAVLSNGLKFDEYER